MKLYELYEEQLDELEMKGLRRAAGAAALAGILATNPSPTQDDSMDTQPKVAQSQEHTLPKNLGQMEVAEKKEAFLNFIIPIANKLNTNIITDREFVLGIKSNNNVIKSDNTRLKQLMTTYKTDNIDTLLARLDIIPVSLIAAQAAIESGWGTSRFARQGNSLFGQRDYSGGGIKPKDATGFTVAKFENIADSVKSYMRNLNTFPHYQGFRKLRKNMRDKGNAIDSTKLANQLVKYSERGNDYIRDVKSVINYNKLQKFDQLI